MELPIFEWVQVESYLGGIIKEFYNCKFIQDYGIFKKESEVSMIKINYLSKEVIIWPYAEIEGHLFNFCLN